MAQIIVTYKGKPRLIEGADELTLEKFIRRSFPGRVIKLQNPTHGRRYIVREG